MAISKVGQRRQVVIPKEICEDLGLKEGDFVEVKESWGFVLIKPKKLVDSDDDILIPEEETLIRKGATIGANATIVCGHDIGAYAFIGAGAVITKNVPPYSLWVGNPARQTGWMSEYGHKLIFDAHGLATCPESQQQYRLSAGEVTRIS